MPRTDEVEFAASAVSIGRTGRPSGWRVRLVVGGWVVVLVGVTAVGLAGHDAGLAVALAPAVIEPSSAPSARSAPTATELGAAPSRAATTRAAASPQRSLGDDGLIGGIGFSDAAPVKIQADVERDGYRRYYVPSRSPEPADAVRRPGS